MELSAKSPDLNPIENIWGVWVYGVYTNARHFSTEQEPRAHVVHEWSKTGSDSVKCLYDSMQKWCVDVLSRQDVTMD